MATLYLLGIVAAFVATAVGVHSLLPSPARVHELRSESASRADVEALTSPILRLMWPLLTIVAPLVRNVGRASYRTRLARDIPLAGLPPVMRIDHLMALKVVLAVALPVLAAMQVEMIRNPVTFIVAGVVSFWVPDRLLQEWKSARQQRIVRALPPAVDMLTLSVEAGLDFLAGLRRVVEKSPEGPLREEINTIVNDIRLGNSRADALRALAERINITEITSFAGVLIQADRLGTPIGDVLRTQSDRMRSERFVRAEKAGAAASQKLLVPLAMFIFPAVLLIMIGPPILTFIYENPI